MKSGSQFVLKSRTDHPLSCRYATLVQMVGAGIGITLIPEMAVAVEARSAQVSIARFQKPRPTRTIGMIWRNSTPLAAQLLQIADVVRASAAAMRRTNAGLSGENS